MSALFANPTDQNLLQGSKFSVSFSRLPYLNFFLQAVNLPGITTNPAVQPTPFIDAPIPADKMKYDPLSMTFLVDEPLYAWTTVQDWLKGLSFPDSFEEYKNLTIQQRLITQNQKPQYSDASLIIMTNKNNPIVKVDFQDLFPVSLSGIDFSTQDPATTIKTATATFAFTNYQVSRSV